MKKSVVRKINNILEQKIIHNFCLNSIESVPEDKSILKFKAVVLDFKKSHNGWAIAKDIADKYKHLLVNKHIVTKYYSEEDNIGLDALGSHEQDETILRGTNGEVTIPITNTRSIGTITNSYIAPLNSDNDSEEVLWCEGILLAWENLNECSLLLEWASNDIPILTSVEWFYTKSAQDNDGTVWIDDPNFSALTILNSEQRGNKDIVSPNYDCSHIEIALNEEHYKDFNNAIMKDVNKKNEEGEKLENIFLKVLNDISFGEIINKIYGALSKVMLAEEYNKIYLCQWDVYDDYFLYDTYENDEWVKIKINYTKNENDEIIVDYASKQQVKREEVFVSVVEYSKEVNELKATRELIETLNGDIETLKVENKQLKEVEKKFNEIQYSEKIKEVSSQYLKEFEEFDGVEMFNSEEVQSLIIDMLDEEKSLNAKFKLQDILIDCAKNSIKSSEESGMSKKSEGQELSVSFNAKGIKNNKSFIDKYGFDFGE